VQGYQPVEALHLYLATTNLPVKRVLSFQGFIPDKKNRRTAKFLIPQMDANIVVSRGLQNWLAENDELETGENFQVLYNGADAARLKPTGKSLKKELNLAEDALLFGMIANFYRDPRKDQLTICRALPKIFSEIKNAHCIFAGKTEEGAESKFQDCADFCRENNIAGRVHFLGSRTDVPDVLAALDLFVFSSLQEGLPIAVTEAMLANVPMIVSDIEPLMEATENGKYAEVFHVQDALELSEKILSLLKDKDLRDDLAKRAFEFARENFSIEAHLENLIALYEDLLTEK
jgi:glycosyltransferase involved in cell wall biosynthesis